MLEGIYVNNVLMHPTIRPYPQQPQNMSGVTLGSKAIYRYALEESDYPTLTIANYLFDGDMDFIPPGHYELALSDEWDFLILLQSKNPVALIPVVKVEEDATEKVRLEDPVQVEVAHVRPLNQQLQLLLLLSLHALHFTLPLHHSQDGTELPPRTRSSSAPRSRPSVSRWPPSFRFSSSLPRAPPRPPGNCIAF